MSKKKKIIVVVAMVVLLAAAAVLNVYLLSDGEKEPEAVATFFQTAKSDKMETREYEISQLDSILQMEGDEYAEARANALKQKNALIEAMELELLVETLLKAQGFSDAIVTVSTSGESINVIVDADTLTREDTARIYSIIQNETSIDTNADYVRIHAI